MALATMPAVNAPLTKAAIRFLKEAKPDAEPLRFHNGGSEPIDRLTFHFNPDRIRVRRGARLLKQAHAGHNVEVVTAASTEPVELTLEKMYFDTYETRENVRTRCIDVLEDLLDYQNDKGAPPCVQFLWGKFTQGGRHNNRYIFFVEDLDVTYTMFLPDATPVRAEVAIKLVQVTDPVDNESPKAGDEEQIYVTRPGDTLQGIAQARMGSCAAWRKIADRNRIDDPMNLGTGVTLYIPRG